MNYRKIALNEVKLIERILSIIKDKNISRTTNVVREIDGEGSIKFSKMGHNINKPPQKALPVEAQFQDIDGIFIHAILFVVDDEVDELEIYKDDGSPVMSKPHPNGWSFIDLRAKDK